MTLRTTAVIAGVLGLLMAITGLISHALRADHNVVAAANPSAAIVVVAPEVLALPGVERIAVTGEGGIQAHSARPVDAAAWLADRDAIYVTGYETWEVLSTSTEPRETFSSPTSDPSPSASGTPAATSSASPSASAPASPSASASPSPSASPAAPTASASPDPTAASEDAAPTAAEISALYGAGDIWREDWRGEGRLALTGAALAPGEFLVFFAEDGSSLQSVEFFTERPVNDSWIAPLIWLGAALALLGGIAAASAVIDIRPLQARLEARRGGRQAEAEAPEPGSRRHKRLAGAAVPEVSLDEVPAEAATKPKTPRSKAAAADAAPADNASATTAPATTAPAEGTTEGDGPAPRPGKKGGAA